MYHQELREQGSTLSPRQHDNGRLHCGHCVCRSDALMTLMLQG